MFLYDLFTDVSANLAAQMAPVAVNTVFGAFARQAKVIPPQVSWELGDDTFEPANPSNRTPGTLHATNPPRAFRTRVSTISCRIWGLNNIFAPVVKTGTGAGTLTPSGLPASTYQVVLKLILGGATGIATFQYSLDNGITYSATLTTGALIALGATGISIAFSGTFTAGDSYTFGAFQYQILDYETTEYLAANFMWALHRSLRGNYELVSAGWSGQDGTEVIQLGKLYKLMFRVRMPLVEVGTGSVTTQVLNSAQQSVGMKFLNGNVVAGIPSP